MTGLHREKWFTLLVVGLSVVMLLTMVCGSAPGPAGHGAPAMIPTFTPTPDGQAPVVTATGAPTAVMPTWTPTSQGVITAAPATQPAPEAAPTLGR